MNIFNIHVATFRPQDGPLLLPIWIRNKSIIVGVAAILLVSLLWSQRIMPAYLWVFYVLELVGFFYGSYYLSNKWKGFSVRTFEKKVITLAIVLRFLFAIYSYLVYVDTYGEVFYDKLPDVEFYVSVGNYVAQYVRDGSIAKIPNVLQSWHVQLDDTGYSFYLAFITLLTGSNQLMPLLLKSIWGALTCLFVYRIGQRHFGEGIARLAAIFCVLNPSMIWWCGSLFKETEMVFCALWFVNGMDALLSKGKVTWLSVLPISIVGMYLFLFRNVLGAVAFLAVLFAVVTTSARMVNRAKKWTIGVIVGLILLVGLGNSVLEQTKAIYNMRGSQKENMAWRSERKDGANSFAKYATGAVFAPLIFTIPFPSLAYTRADQEHIMQLAGGNIGKNLLSYFVILAMFILLFSGEWRVHSFPLAYMLGYLVVIALSAFAQSGRFHMPVVPLEMLFSAYGIAIAKTNPRYKRWFSYVVVAELVICLGWSWFKLRGQGLI